ncbi:hypothetical protein DES40_1692 [Litorimonas taeanensis]|uniref:Lipoprotein n=1 Tax=Litorimonas taeanensis TaxID=568099 RepID=A0A420WD27_9PROT|nr:hypothetical protein [Litorimonas taeanensis]RKQ68917.1 hypothetical protein DES40_1692 [Litorimonas taeanensis]
MKTSYRSFLSRFSVAAILLPAFLVACADNSQPQNEKLESHSSPQVSFVDNLQTLCGKTLTGAVVSQDPQDVDWRAEALTVGPIDCTEMGAVMPLAVGEDKSRVWTISKQENGLKLSHAHTLKDGSPDPVTAYGGTTEDIGTATKQHFPADNYSKTLFATHGLDASVTNVWSLEIIPNKIFAYELNREGRHFRAEFDLAAQNSH